eukprot:6370324-Amphidinium_carterae.1
MTQNNCTTALHDVRSLTTGFADNCVMFVHDIQNKMSLRPHDHHACLCTESGIVGFMPGRMANICQ